ncbi:hypothetical protein BTJ40_13425 [Microbulbifer sp. A4B17]|nr:hypothetical protein BTJ40_13425 [Microbulbifer sp. A4B17]
MLNKIITNQTTEKLCPQKDESIFEIGPGNGSLSLPILNSLGDDRHYLGIKISEIVADEI